MSDKSAGVDFDRQVFVQPREPVGRPATVPVRVVLTVAVIVVVAFLGYLLLLHFTQDTTSAGDAALAGLDKRLAAIEDRLDTLEATRKTAFAAKKEPTTDPRHSPARTVYQISPTPYLPVRTPPDPEPAVAQRLSAVQQKLGALQNDATANREAWQATTDKLTDMAGQVGTQGVEILRSQDELNQLLARTEMEAIPFELRRGSNPQLVGPVSLVLKSASPKSQRYTVCVYIQPSCVELKNRTLHEVVQFVIARNTPPLELIATKILKDEILGYLEVPRSPSGH